MYTSSTRSYRWYPFDHFKLVSGSFVGFPAKNGTCRGFKPWYVCRRYHSASFVEHIHKAVPRFSAAEIARICEPISMEARLITKGKDMERIVEKIQEREYKAAEKAQEVGIEFVSPKTDGNEEAGDRERKRRTDISCEPGCCFGQHF